MFTKSRKKLPFSWKRVAVIVACGIVLIGIANIFLRKYTTTFLSKQIHQAVATSTHHLYRIHFDDVQTNIVAGNISLFNVVIKLDTVVYNAMVRQKKAPEYVLDDLQMARLDIEHISLWKAIFNRSIDIQSILIDKPILTIVRQPALPSAGVAPTNKTFYQQMEKHVKSLHIGEIRIDEMDIKYINQSIQPQKVTRIKNATLHITDLLVDSLSQYDPTRLWYTKDIVASIQNHQYQTEDKLYTIHFDEISGSTARADMKLTGLRVIPNFAEMEPLMSPKKQRQRYAMEFEEIVLNKMNYALLIAKQQLAASALAIKGANLDIFVNRAMPDKAFDRGPNYPSLALKRIPFDLQIDTIKWDQSKLSYSEYNPLSSAKGTLYFEQMNGKLAHLTNNAAALAKNKFCNAVATGLMMGNGALAVKLKFDLVDTLGSFTFSGNLGRMNARILNPALRPFALIKIGKGLIENISFSGSGNTQGCRGNLTAKYSQLRIGILAKDSTKFKKQTLASLYTSIIVLRSENPSNDDGLLHTSAFAYTRPLQASFFKVIWKGIAAGLMDNIGLGVAAQRRLKDKASAKKK